MNNENISIEELFEFHNKRNYVTYINGVLKLNVHFLTPERQLFNLRDNNILKFDKRLNWREDIFEIYKNIHRQILES